MTNKLSKLKSIHIAFAFLVAILASQLSIAKNKKSDGAVYAMTNSSKANKILVYNRAANGTIRFFKKFNTGGKGSGGKAPIDPVDALGAQNPLVLSQDDRLLFAVNANSNTISVFEVRNKNNSLHLIQKIASGGHFPVSITQRNNIVYVLNSGGEGNITGFTLLGTDPLNTSRLLSALIL